MSCEDVIWPSSGHYTLGIRTMSKRGGIASGEIGGDANAIIGRQPTYLRLGAYLVTLVVISWFVQLHS